MSGKGKITIMAVAVFVTWLLTAFQWYNYIHSASFWDLLTAVYCSLASIFTMYAFLRTWWEET